jgi:hypothetical protein
MQKYMYIFTETVDYLLLFYYYLLKLQMGFNPVAVVLQ